MKGKARSDGKLPRARCKPGGGISVKHPVRLWRAYASRNKRRLEWAAAVHTPAPVIVFLRFVSGVTFDLRGLLFIALFVAT